MAASERKALVPPTVKLPAVFFCTAKTPVPENVPSRFTASAVIFVLPDPAARDDPASKFTALPVNAMSLLFVFVTAPVTLTVSREMTASGACTAVVPISMLPVWALPICTVPVPESMKERSAMAISAAGDAAGALTDIVLPAVRVSIVTAPFALERTPVAPAGRDSASVLTLIVPPAVLTFAPVPRETLFASKAV